MKLSLSKGTAPITNTQVEWSCSVVSDSLQPHGLWSSRCLCPWDYLGKNTGVGCHFFHQGILLTQGLNLCLLHLLHWQADFFITQQPGEALINSCLHAKSPQSCLTLCDLWTLALQAPLSMGFSRQECWSGFPCPPPGNLPAPGIKRVFLNVSFVSRQVLYH